MLMMEHPKDVRPEGTVLLQAAMYGAWNAALYIAQHAAIAGKTVTIEATEHHDMLGLPLQTIGVTQ